MHVVMCVGGSYTTCMFQSHYYSHLFLRMGLAIVFLWLGIEKFMEPHSWIGSTTPQWIIHTADVLGMSATNVFVLTGIFEVLVATSLITAFFEQWFAPAGALFLAASIVVTGFSSIAAYDIGIIGGLLALMLWPQRRYS